ncbi:hypothetical protein X471_00844 [Bartonella bacilliformis str. Heidi Mejia]|nr:hypothetical protein X472_00837 [Bartonella bacilliformis San Pedro600-02]EYS90712.1 hypothetical protein X471_00844 [Bartonella bacilliformis str. Heidi Mejia]EYS95451.1 hypothetical protein X470_00039 [Bartonella bacilliformis Peru-18]KEG18074.1 hypothetical protein H705_00114 [Bartonella bacilliformis Cond044]KEG18471.1 hypothetical protein H709_00114 [Bartonella bacilliformis CUSCO5]KEG20687.1 hypothetical protein H707_00113 [Bartonella bacilliformis Hosp800-02]KEG22097.1 hypothetical 
MDQLLNLDMESTGTEDHSSKDVACAAVST